MLKKDLIQAVSEKTGRSKEVVKEINEAILSVVLQTLAGGASVMLLGLGRLTLGRRGEKVARNLHTGEKVLVPPRTVVKFGPSVAVTAAINPV